MNLRHEEDRFYGCWNERMYLGVRSSYTVMEGRIGHGGLFEKKSGDVCGIAFRASDLLPRCDH